MTASTASSELFIDETIRDELKEVLQKQGIDATDVRVEVPDDWKDIWNDSCFPESGEAKVFLGDSEDGQEIGTVKWRTEFAIEQGLGGRYIVAEPKELEFVPKSAPPVATR